VGVLDRVCPSSHWGRTGANDNQDGVTLAVQDVASDDLVMLRWDWTIHDGVSKPTLYASVQTAGGAGALIFTGPISRRVTGCQVDGNPTDVVLGRPAFQVREAPAVTLVKQSLVSRIEFDITARPPGGPVIYCDLQDGYSADDPPYHQLYTPELRIAAQGTVQAEPSRFSVCASRNAPGLPTESECMDGAGWTTTAVVPMSVEELNRPAEQGLRDARLVILGVLAGLTGQAIWELVRQLLQRGQVGVRELLVQAQSLQAESGEDGVVAQAETADVPSSADSVAMGNDGENVAMDNEGENMAEPSSDAVN